MEEIDMSWRRVVSVWWLILWRSVLGGGVIGAIVGGLVGFIMGLLHYPMDQLVLAVRIVVLPFALAWGVFILRTAFKKRYSGFRLAVIKI